MADLIDQPLPGFGGDGPVSGPVEGPNGGSGDVALPTAKIVLFPIRRALDSRAEADVVAASEHTPSPARSETKVTFNAPQTPRRSAASLSAMDRSTNTVGPPNEAELTQAAMDAHPATGRQTTAGPRRPGARSTPSAPRRTPAASSPTDAPAAPPSPTSSVPWSSLDDASNRGVPPDQTPDQPVRTARSHGHSTRHRVRRPGAVGGVVVRAPMLDPTRHRVGPTPARRLLGSKAPDAAPHPRVAKRLDDVRRSRRQRTFRPAVALLVAAVVMVAIAIVVLFSPFFEVTRVDVRFQGTAAQNAELSSLIAPVRGQNIVRLDLADTQSAIAAMPWVARVSVTRGLPHTVRISVVAHDVAGAVKLANGTFAITASDATVLEVAGEGDPALTGLPTIDLGLGAIPVAGDQLGGSAPDVLASASSVEHRFPGQLRSVTVVDGEVEWMVRPQPGAKAIRVRVGAPTSSDVPAAALASVLARTGPSPLGIDLRTPDTPVVQTAPAA